MSNSGIYRITNTKNGKFYIGSSKHIDRRWWEHTNDLNKKQHINPKLQHAWTYYGANAFEFIVVESVDKSNLITREQFYLDTFTPYQRNIGYNISDKAIGGDTLTNNPKGQKLIDEWRKKYSESHKGVGNPMFGKQHSTDAVDKQKQKAVGRYTLSWFVAKHGEEVGVVKYAERNKKLSGRKINHVYDNGLTGKKRGPMSDEMKRKISEQKKSFALRKKDFMVDLISSNFSGSQLRDKYGISLTSIKRYKRELN